MLHLFTHDRVGNSPGASPRLKGFTLHKQAFHYPGNLTPGSIRTKRVKIRYPLTARGKTAHEREFELA